MPLMGTMGALATQKTSDINIQGSRKIESSVGPGSPATLTVVNNYPGQSNLLSNVTATSGYTLEYWVRYTVLSATGINTLAVGDFNPGFSSSWFLQVMGDGSIQFKFSGGYVNTSTGIITTNTWANIALVLTNSGSNTTIQIFVNGTIRNIKLNNAGSSLPSITILSSQLPSTGAWLWAPTLNTPSQQCYLDEVRVSDIARYTSNYTTATTQFAPDVNTNLLWHFQYNTTLGINTPVIDSSQNDFGYFSRYTYAASSPIKF